MWRRLLRWLSPLLLAGACLLPATRAQQPAGTKSGSTEKPDNSERAPVFQYVLALVSLLIILLILCKPSRKS
jgi:hypothetical protein